MLDSDYAERAERELREREETQKVLNELKEQEVRLLETLTAKIARFD